MHVLPVYRFMLFVGVLCILPRAMTASVGVRRRALDMNNPAAQAAQESIKNSRSKGPEFHPEYLDPIPEHQEVLQFTSPKDHEAAAERERLEEMLRRLNGDGSGSDSDSDEIDDGRSESGREGSVDGGSGSNPEFPANGGSDSGPDMVRQRASWLQRLTQRWKARIAAWRAPNSAKQLSRVSAEMSQDAPNSVGSVQDTRSAKTLITADAVQTALDSAIVPDQTQFFKFVAISDAPLTVGTKIPVVRIDSLKDDAILNAVSYGDVAFKRRTVIFAFSNGQIFKAEPQKNSGFLVEAVKDPQTLSEVEEALSRPIVVPPPRKARISPTPGTTDWNFVTGSTAEASARATNFEQASLAPTGPLSDKDTIKKAFERHKDPIARYFDLPGLLAAPRTANNIPIVEYETLDDSRINAFSLLHGRQSIILVGPDGRSALVQREANGQVGVMMYEQWPDSLRQDIKTSTDVEQAGAGLRTSPARTQEGDLYPVDRSVLLSHKDAARANAGAGEAARSWWKSVSTGARTWLDKFTPSLKYGGHAG